MSPVLSIENLSIDYLAETTVHAVREVSLTLERGEILGLAGESGCGKSTLAYAITRLLKPPARITSGRVVFSSREGYDVACRGSPGTTCGRSAGTRSRWSSRAR